MEIIRALKMRIYPNEQQLQQINHTLDCCRFVYNYMLARSQKAYTRRHETMTCYDMINLLPQMKRYFPWLKGVNAQALQYACKQLSDAHLNFLYKRANYPRFKKKRSSIQSYRLQYATSLRYIPGSISLPSLKSMKCSDKRILPKNAKICYATISKESDKYYASITYKYEKNVITKSIDENQVIGLDYKSDGLYCDNNGNIAHMPHWYRLEQNDLSKQERKLSKKQGSREGEEKSNRWLKQYKRVVKRYRHITNQRKDYLHKESTRLAQTYDAICVENLNMISIASNNLHNGKATLDNGYGMFLRFLNYKLQEQGKQLVIIDKWYASSQICHCCGMKNTAIKDLNIRQWTCPNCGSKHDRDINAAQNIKHEGLKQLVG